MNQVNIIGAGLAGLSAAMTLAEQGFACNLISLENSERAQSVLAEGGINAAWDVFDGGRDHPDEHYRDTMKGGCWIADPDAVRGLTSDAPGIVKDLLGLGVPFHMKNGKLVLRNFGGQKNKRTAYAKSSTGKVIVSALVDRVRKYEAEGLVVRYPHHEFIRIHVEAGNGKKRCTGVRIRDIYTGKLYDCPGIVVLATGGMNGFFPGMTTGTVSNSGDVTATVFAQGVRLSNLEMIQYHPTTIGISGKRLLVTEAARGEGGRLCVMRDGAWWYFMEELYQELKNLMPRDVISREMYQVVRRRDCEAQVYLDMTDLSEEIWQTKLPDMRKELMDYLGLDPKTERIPVEPGIHYFMAGMDVDIHHRTNIENLYAAGECTSQYHGANRLGGNSMLGAIRGGKVAAADILECAGRGDNVPAPPKETADRQDAYLRAASPRFIKEESGILLQGLGIVRNEPAMREACGKLEELKQRAFCVRERNRALLGQAMLQSALFRKESRGAHYREDYPDRSDAYKKMTLAEMQDGRLQIGFKE